MVDAVVMVDAVSPVFGLQPDDELPEVNIHFIRIRQEDSTGDDD